MTTHTIHTIDANFLGLGETIAVYAVESRDGLVLIDCAPETCTKNVVAGLEGIGAAASDVKHVVITHIHMDHAGAAGWWAKQGAHVYVHERGAKHLIDPSQLIASAMRIYGDRMELLWGEMRPIPADQLTALADNDVLNFGDVTMTAWETFGHARHHHAYVVEGMGHAFTGDVTGVRLNDNPYTALASAPPQFHAEEKLASLERLEAAELDAIYPTHFGRIDDVAEHLARYKVIVQSSADLVYAYMRNGADDTAIAEHFRQFQWERALLSDLPKEIWDKHEATNKSAMSAAGVQLYWKKRFEQ